jgi:anti-sigma regulatory factor (Ser/Thr protein kinase)
MRTPRDETRQHQAGGPAAWGTVDNGLLTKTLSTKDMTTATSKRPHQPMQDRRAEGQTASRRLRMAGDVASIRAARRLVEDALQACSPVIPTDRKDTAVLIAGEIVTNAVVHGGGWFLLHVDARPDRLRVEVTDSSPGQPRILTMTGEREHGRGMAIVDAIATAWGTEHLGTHKVVWFELDLQP